VTTATQRGEGPSTDGPPPGTALASHRSTESTDSGESTDSTAPFSGTFRQAEAVADAVLYEGYLLYPYRRSSPKNRVRWQFGVLAPRAVIEAAGPADTSVAGSADAWYQQTDCLLEARDDATLHVRLRFLQVQHRAVEASSPAGGFTAVDALAVDGRRHLTFDEAVAHEFDVECTVGDLLAAPRTVEVTAPGDAATEPLLDAAGVESGRIVRRTRPLSARLRLSLSAATAPFPLHRLRIVVENAVDDVPPDADRPEALRRSLVAAHCLLGLRGGRFLSLLEPPLWAAAAVGECRNVHTFPVLAGADDGRDVVLSSPIILYDHPQIAPESPGPLFDSGEIDEILSLRTMTLTDEEKDEVRATDPQAAAILDRVDHLPEEVLARLHGAVRSLRPVAREPGSVLVGGVRVAAGCRVRLHPRRHGTDAQDVFLDGRTATVDRVLHDVDGSRFLAVTLDDDPGGELLSEYGRHYHFAPDEIEALP
jgi:hypothetical protein